MSYTQTRASYIGHLHVLVIVYLIFALVNSFNTFSFFIFSFKFFICHFILFFGEWLFQNIADLSLIYDFNSYTQHFVTIYNERSFHSFCFSSERITNVRASSVSHWKVCPVAYTHYRRTISHYFLNIQYNTLFISS